MMDDSERDALLIRMDTRQEIMVTDIKALKTGMYGDDGQGGVCGRVTKLESFQSTVLAFVTSITIGVTLAANWVISWLSTKGGN